MMLFDILIEDPGNKISSYPDIARKLAKFCGGEDGWGLEKTAPNNDDLNEGSAND